MPTAFLRTAFAVFLVTPAGCAIGIVGDASGETSISPAVHTLVLARGQKTIIADESLAVELTTINDSRCPAKVTCIWAGHAAVTLEVSKPGSATDSVVIGSEAPSSMNLPSDADYGGYRFHLVELEPGNADGSTQATPSQRATITVSRIQGQ